MKKGAMKPNGGRWRDVVRAGSAVLATVLVVACAAPIAPVFERQRRLEGLSLLLAPEIQIGSRMAEAERDELSTRLAAALRQALAEGGVLVSSPADPERFGEARRDVVRAWRRESPRGMGGIRAGAPVVGGSSLAVLRESGAETLLVALLARTGLTAPDGEYVPRPSGELMELPDDRNDYEIPTPEEFAADGYVLELLIVDVKSGRVVDERRAAEPGSPARMGIVLDNLVRLVTRGLGGAE